MFMKKKTVLFTSPIMLLVSFYQPFAAVLQNSCSWKFRNIHRETPLLDSLFNNVVGLQACNFINNRLRYRCFPMNNAKFLRTLFLTELLWTTAPGYCCFRTEIFKMIHTFLISNWRSGIVYVRSSYRHILRLSALKESPVRRCSSNTCY